MKNTTQQPLKRNYVVEPQTHLTVRLKKERQHISKQIT